MERLTGCWETYFEFYGWSNVACVLRDHWMYPEMEKLSSRYAKFQEEYYIPLTGVVAAAADAAGAEAA